tara:strand:+ start:111 stop:494 length:384 start_codon:yes stop_codon:yes gene_type:complete
MEVSQKCLRVLAPIAQKFLTSLANHELEIKNIIKDWDELEAKNNGTLQARVIHVFIIYTFQSKHGVGRLRKVLTDGGISVKLANSFIYDFLKLQHKTKHGIWSWNEIEELDIELDDVKVTSSSYTVI